MDIANQLEKLSQPLNNVDESLVKLNQTVEQLAATMGVVQEEESKGIEFIKKTKKLSEIDRIIQARQFKFDKQKLSFDLKNFRVFKDINLKFNKGMALTTAKVQKFGMDMAKTGKEFVVALPKKILKGFLSIPGKIFRGIGSVLRKGFSNVFGTLGKSVSGIFKKIVPLAGVLAVPSLIIRQLMKVDEAMASIAQNTGLFGKNLKMVQQNTIDAASGLYAFGINLEDVSKQSSALVDSLGSASLVTDKLIENTAMIAKATGMSAQEAANLSAALIKGFGKTDEQVKSFTENMMNFASSSGVNARKVMRDIANDSNLTSIYLARGENYLANSAILAAKMGKSMAEQNQTLDAFADIETSIQNVEKINRLTGSNLNAQKMQMMFMTQDVQGLFGELNKAFSSPLAKARLQAMPGAFKEIAGALNLSIKDLREMPRVMREFAKASAPASKEQVTIEKAISDATTTIDKLKNIFFQFVLPAFNNLGEFLVNKISPSIEGIVQSASDFGKELNKAMDADDTFLGKVKTAFRMILEGLQPTLIEMFNTIRPHLEEMVDSIVHRFRSGLGYFGKLIFGGNEDVDIEPVAGDVYQTNKSHRMMGGAAKGRVVDSASLFMVGEEGRSEVIIPTERIRKGLPVDPAVAKELSSIGVPGFSMGAFRVSAGALDQAANTFEMNQQRRAVLMSQGDPEAVRRTEAKIEAQAAEVRKNQRKIINEIVKARTDADRAGYFSGNPGGSPFAPPADGGGDRGRRRRGFDFHDAANTLDNFMMLTGYTFGDFFNMLPDAIEKPIEAAFNMLPDSLQTGLTTGTQAAWNAYIETGNFEAALKTGVITGLQQGGEQAKGGILGQTALLGAEFMRTGDLRGAAATTLSTSMRDQDSFFGNYFMGAQQSIAQRTQLQSINDEDFATFQEEERANLDKKFDAMIGPAVGAVDKAEKGVIDLQERQADQIESTKSMFDEAAKNAKNDEIRNQIIADGERELIRQRATHADALSKRENDLQTKKEALLQIEMDEEIETDLLKETQEEAAAAHAEAGTLSVKLLKDAAKDQAMVGGMQGVLEALQAGEGLAGAAKTGLSRAAGGATAGAISAGITAINPALAPVAGMVGSFVGDKVSGLVGKGLGKFFGLGGKNVKPKKAARTIADVIVDGLGRASAPGNQLVDFFKTGSFAHNAIKANIALASQDPDKLIVPVQAALQSNSGRRFSRDETLGFIQLLYGKGLNGADRDQSLIDFESAMEGRAPMRRGATGAIVSRPTVALIGEAGPEAVVPLENSPGSRPLNGAGGDNGELLQEIKRMNQMLGAMANRPITLDGQRVNAVLNTVNSDDIRAGIYTVNSR